MRKTDEEILALADEHFCYDGATEFLEGPERQRLIDLVRRAEERGLGIKFLVNLWALYIDQVDKPSKLLLDDAWDYFGTYWVR